MTLPTTTTLNGCDDDSDMFGPPRSSPPIGYRSRVPMISPKLRQREERKRILQLCAHKLERIKDSETNLRRSVCINNTYCRLTDELRREKQSRYLANLPKSEVVPETARENIFNPYNSCGIDSSNHQPSNRNNSCNNNNNNNNNINNNNNNENACNNQNNVNETTTLIDTEDHIDVVHDDDDDVFKQAESNNNEAQKPTLTTTITTTTTATPTTTTMNDNNNNHVLNSCHNSTTASTSCSITSCCNTIPSMSSTTSTQSTSMRYKRHQSNSSNTLDNDLEILDRELNAINAPPLLIDPEITQGAEQLEKALLSSSRKRARIEDESDRLVREALSQFYIPPQRFISAIEDCPLDLVSVGVSNGGMRHEWHMGGLGVSGAPTKRAKLDYEANISYTTNNNNNSSINDLELDFDMNPNQKDFEVIMDALRLGTPSPTNSNDSCGQAAMMLSESASVFHNLVVASLET